MRMACPQVVISTNQHNIAPDLGSSALCRSLQEAQGTCPRTWCSVLMMACCPGVQAAIFGGEAATAQGQSEPSPALPALAARPSVALGDLEDALDGATVVELPEEDSAPLPASAAEPSPEATGAAATSISWRERAAQIQAKRMQAKRMQDLTVGA